MINFAMITNKNYRRHHLNWHQYNANRIQNTYRILIIGGLESGKTLY